MGVYKSTRSGSESLVCGPDSNLMVDPWIANAKAKCREDYIQKLYLQYHEELLAGIIKKFRIDRNEAEDVVQTAFTRFAETSSNIDNPRAFLYKVCSNIVIDQMRKRQIQQNYTQEVAVGNVDSMDDITPERLIEGRQRLGIVSRALWAMPNKRRQLLMMSRLEGLSYAEIARRVNLSESVVRKHIAKALAGCQKALQAQLK